MEKGDKMGFEEKPGTSGKSCCWGKLCLIIVHVLVFLVMAAFNGLTSSDTPVAGLFQGNTGDISDKYNTALTPAGWTFTIWAVIYLWQGIHIAYTLSTLCRKSSAGHYLFTNPGHIHSAFYIVYIINNALNIAWLFVFDREMMVAAFIVLFLIALSLYICGVIVCRFLEQSKPFLQGKDIWMTRFFTLNGIAVYGTWTSIATLLNMSIVLEYMAGVNSVTCAWISLGILTAELLVWFVLETFVFRKYLLYCFSPYIVLLVAFNGVISKNFDAANPTAYMIYVFALLGLSCVFFIVKVALMVYRFCQARKSFTV